MSMKYEQQRRNILCNNQMMEKIRDWGYEKLYRRTCMHTYCNIYISTTYIQNGNILSWADILLLAE